MSMSHTSLDTVKKLQKGMRFKILGYGQLSQTYRRRLIAMGLTPNAIFTLVRVAPMGDPVEVRIEDTSVVLRKQELGELALELA
jgi:ferrous iron transport protein A